MDGRFQSRAHRHTHNDTHGDDSAESVVVMARTDGGGAISARLRCKMANFFGVCVWKGMG